MSLRSISPAEAKVLIDQGARVVDVREPFERARLRIAGSQAFPLSGLSKAELPPGPTPIIFHCTAGVQTTRRAPRLAEKAGGQAYELEGGLDAWCAAGLPVIVAPSQPINILRQVQITAGGLVLLGTALGAFVSPLWYVLPPIMGAGLMLSGITGSCAMANALSRMPWNRAAA